MPTTIPTSVSINRFVQLLLMLLLIVSQAQVSSARGPWDPPESGAWVDPWIINLSGIHQDQEVTGTVYVQTHVTGLDDADFDMRYQVDGPSGFIYTAYDEPFKLGGDKGWDTSNAIPGQYKLHAFLIRNHRCIAFRIFDFTVVHATQITAIKGIESGQVLTEPTHVEAIIEGITPTRVTFSVDGPLNLNHTEREEPYRLLGDNQYWVVENFPNGAYTLTVRAYVGDDVADVRTVSFYIGEAVEDISGEYSNDTGKIHGGDGYRYPEPTYPSFDNNQNTGNGNTAGTDEDAGNELSDSSDESETNADDDSSLADNDNPDDGNTSDDADDVTDENETGGMPEYADSNGTGDDATADANTDSTTEVDDAADDSMTDEVADGSSGDDATTQRPDVGPLPDGYDRGFLGMNLAEVTYYSREWVFVDVMKQARPWLPTTPGSSSPWNSGEDLKLNENGYPLLADGQAAHTHMMIATDGAHPAGKYVCTYDGDGEIEFAFDAKITSRVNNRIELSVTPSDNGIYLRIDRSNRSNPVRNIKVWMPGFENAVSSFHPLYLERLKPFSVIRFMDWMHTNTTDIVTWSDRPQKDYYTQATNRGVALEYMIELCNELGADPWFCMPHTADDAYVYSFAKQVKQQLRPDLNVYVEWSNEVWNSQFKQHKWVQQVTDSDSLSDAFRKRWAYEANRDFNIWREVFADQSHRVIRLAVGQKDNPWVTETLTDELEGRFDAISCSTYFGFTGSQESQLNAGTSPQQILNWAIQDITNGSVRRNYRAHGKLAEAWSETLGRTIPLIGYEGGQHYTAYGLNPPWAQAMINAQRHPLMYDAYIANMREWKDAGGSLFTAFNYVSTPSKWGSWGQLEYMDQDIAEAPKFRALLEFEP